LLREREREREGEGEGERERERERIYIENISREYINIYIENLLASRLDEVNCNVHETLALTMDKIQR